jgi:hypothetical protein
VYIEFRWGILRETDHLEGPGVDGRIVRIKMGLQEMCGGAWTGLIWLRTGTGGGLL